jgi:hypothetical protein
VQEWTKSDRSLRSTAQTPSNGIVSQLQRFLFDSTEPSLKPREMKWILLTRIHKQNGTRGFELRTSAFSKHWNYRRRDRCGSHLPFQRRSDQRAAPSPQLVSQAAILSNRYS